MSFLSKCHIDTSRSRNRLVAVLKCVLATIDDIPQTNISLNDLTVSLIPILVSTLKYRRFGSITTSSGFCISSTWVGVSMNRCLWPNHQLLKFEINSSSKSQPWYFDRLTVTFSFTSLYWYPTFPFFFTGTLTLSINVKSRTSSSNASWRYLNHHL